MAFITREDGEHFVIPSYRDILSAKKKSLLKDEILALCQNYGNYITLQKKNIDQYEAAFSQDPGYLLGESAWYHFKRPQDMVYCELLPNKTEALLVVVKSGSVYLDGSFPVDSIPEELVVFVTQKNNFDIFIYGDVPISQTPEAGKFAFDAAHIKSFKVLSNPAFQDFSKVKAFKLEPVDRVLAAHGIGAISIKTMMVGVVALGLIWMAWNYLTTHKKELPRAIVGVINPYQAYIRTLASPPPFSIVKRITTTLTQVLSIPGWVPANAKYIDGKIRIDVKSMGVGPDILVHWAKKNLFDLQVGTDGFYLERSETFFNRVPPKTIYKINNTIATLVDRYSYVLPGNVVKVNSISARGQYKEAAITVTFAGMTNTTLYMIGEQLNNLPLVLSKMDVSFVNGYFSGTINLLALGN